MILKIIYISNLNSKKILCFPPFQLIGILLIFSTEKSKSKLFSKLNIWSFYNRLKNIVLHSTHFSTPVLRSIRHLNTEGQNLVNNEG